MFKRYVTTYRLTLGEQASPSPPPCRHAKNPVTGHCKHCLLATRKGLCVQSNPCHLHVAEDDTFWQKVAKHEQGLKTRRENEKRKRDRKKAGKALPPPDPSDVIDIEDPASPNDTAAPKDDAPVDPRDVVTVGDSNEQSPAPPHSPAASVSSLESIGDADDEGDQKDDDDGSDSTISLLDMSKYTASSARNTLPAKVQHERKSNAKMFARVVGELDARDATLRLHLANARGGAVHECKVVRPQGTSDGFSLRTVLCYVLS